MVLQDRSIWDKLTKWKEAIWKKWCPFCLEEQEITLWKWNYWHIRKNKYPYNWNEKHLLLIPNRHIEHTSDLNNEELIELKEAEKFLKDFYKEENYFSFIRQTNWWKSIKHIHYHYIPWILYSSELEKILTNK